MSDNYMPLQNNLHILKDMEGCEIVAINELGIYFEFVYLKDDITKHIVLKALGIHNKFSETQYSKFDISLESLDKVTSFDGITEKKVKSTTFEKLAKINQVSFNSKSSSYRDSDSLVLHGESNEGKPLNYFIDIMLYDNPTVSLHSHKFLSEIGVQETIDTYGYVAFAQPSDIMSQWYICEFRDAHANAYNSCEQYMMARKALLFNDANCFSKIMASEDMKNIKQFGKEVADFKQEIWDEHKEKIVYDANFLKFSQNQELKEPLLKSAQKMIIEVNPNDIVWACGCFEKDASAPSLWRGENLLGQILMRVREDLKDDEKFQRFTKTR